MKYKCGSYSLFTNDAIAQIVVEMIVDVVLLEVLEYNYYECFENHSWSLKTTLR